MFTEPVDAHKYTPADRAGVLAFLPRAARLHEHLDWFSQADWWARPGLVAVVARQGEAVRAVLACSSPQDGICWLRVLAVDGGVSVGPAVRAMWAAIIPLLRRRNVNRVFMLHVQDWTYRALQTAGFSPVETVITLLHRYADPALPPPVVSGAVALRPVTPDALPQVEAVDRAAFAPQWRLTPDQLQIGLGRAAHFTVAEADGQVVGYEVTLLYDYGAHLTRLAVQPGWQGRGIGRALLRGVMAHFQGQVPVLTVNTQASNTASLHLYRQAGFSQNGSRVSVLEVLLH